MGRRGKGGNPWVTARSALIALVSVTWAVSIATSILSDTYEPDPSINALFSGVIGAVLTVGQRKSDDD